MKIRTVEFSKAQRGWVVEITFSYLTARQFTDETSLVRESARYWWWAWVRARRTAKRYARNHAPLPGERERKGW